MSKFNNLCVELRLMEPERIRWVLRFEEVFEVAGVTDDNPATIGLLTLEAH